ncbi:glycoside hydrolase family 13 protein [Lachnospiraceae bacterium C1.1]|nr:alpha-glucosidase [Lachnospiraceae bacterium C1.1]
MNTGLSGAENKRKMKWWQESIVYEIYVKSFKDSNGDGIGDINGIIEKLDYLRSLGIGAIWLTPVYKSPQADNGYDIADYYKIDESYGSMEDMERLISEAGKRNIKIVMDLVFNHTSDKNEWFLESKASHDNEKSSWYIWRDAKPDGSEPNNWRSIFGGSAWTWCEERGQYYLHTFLPEQPDLNWENPDMRQAVYDVANFWVKKGVGGFRMDAVTYIKKPEDFSDGREDAADGMAGIHSMTANTKGILDFLHEFKENVQKGTDIFCVGEANGVSASELPEWVGNRGVFDMIFEFSHIDIDLDDETDWCRRRKWKLSELKSCITASQTSTAREGWYPIFFENHDQGRSIDHFFADSKDPVSAGKALAAALMTLRGTPFIYQGEEIGIRNLKLDSIDSYEDISTINHYKFARESGHTEKEAMDAVHHFSRDNARTPMQWTAGDHAGFSSADPWFRLSDDYKDINVEAESSDENSLLSWYRKLLGVRRSRVELINGDYREIMHENEQIYAYIRDNGEKSSLVLINFSDRDAAYDPEIIGSYEFLISSCGDKAAKGSLRPYEAVIYKD